MTSHYLDVQLRPDPEFPATQLMSALFAKLHRALVARQETRVAVSFPGYSKVPPIGLGTNLRLLGPESVLGELRSSAWCSGMAEMVNIGLVLPVPQGALHRQLKRVQADSSAARLRRRAMKRHGLSEVEAEERIPEHARKRLKLPFVQLSSGSTGQRFRLFLDLLPPSPETLAGEFNAYGLSDQATTPHF